MAMFDPTFWFALLAGAFIPVVFGFIYDVMLASATRRVRRVLRELHALDPGEASHLEQEFNDTPTKLRLFVASRIIREARRAWQPQDYGSGPPPNRRGQQRRATAQAAHAAPERPRPDHRGSDEGLPVPVVDAQPSDAQPVHRDQSANAPALVDTEPPALVNTESHQPVLADLHESSSAAQIEPVVLTSASRAVEETASDERRKPAKVSRRRAHRLMLRLTAALNFIAKLIGGELGEAAAEVAATRSKGRPLIGLIYALTNPFGLLKARIGDAVSRLSFNIIDVGYRGIDIIVASPALSGAAAGALVAVPLVVITVSFGPGLALCWAGPAAFAAERLRRVARRKWGTRWWRPGRTRADLPDEHFDQRE